MTTLERLKKLVEDGDTWFGIFQNQDLGHPHLGEKCIFPFSLSDGSFEKAEVGKTHAPDGRLIGMGWRYILMAKTPDAVEANRLLTEKDKV